MIDMKNSLECLPSISELKKIKSVNLKLGQSKLSTLRSKKKSG